MYTTVEQINVHFDEELTDSQSSSLLKRIDGYKLIKGQDDRTLDVNPYILEFLINGCLARPASNRSDDKLQGDSILDWFIRLFENTGAEIPITISNGSVAVTLTVNEWTDYLSLIDRLFVVGQSVVISGYEKTARKAEKYQVEAL